MINAVSSIFTWCAEGRREKLEPWVSHADVEDAGLGPAGEERGRRGLSGLVSPPEQKSLCRVKVTTEQTSEEFCVLVNVFRG